MPTSVARDATYFKPVEKVLLEEGANLCNKSRPDVIMWSTPCKMTSPVEAGILKMFRYMSVDISLVHVLR